MVPFSTFRSRNSQTQQDLQLFRENFSYSALSEAINWQL